MSTPMLMLGGVPIVIHAGPPAQQFSPLGGPEIVRLTGGVGVPMTHWQRTSISISGSGWMPPGLDGLDYSQPLDLLCTKPLSIVSPQRHFRLSGTPRGDVDPWAQALVGEEWRRAEVIRNGMDIEVLLMPSATLYRVSWMPAFVVSARPPQEDVDLTLATYGWRIDCEEL